MFSSRFHWDARPNRITRLLEARLQSGDEVLDLTESNPTRAGLAWPEETLASLADPRALRYDPTPSGLPEARGAVAAYYAERGHSVGRERILLTASTSEGYAYLFKLLTNPGDEVLAPRPSYPLFEFLGGMESVAVRSYPLVYHGGWSIDLDALRHEINERTRAIIVVNPNNPTGSFVKQPELEVLVRLCRDYDLALISDEVFADYAFGPDPHRAGSLCDVRDCLAFSMSGLSKVAGMPQMKLGWIVVAGPPRLQAEALEKLEWIADTYLSVSSPVQYAAPRLLAAGESIRRQIGERTRSNLEWLRLRLAGTAAGVLAVEGGWYAILQVPRIRSEEDWVLELLGSHGILVQPGFFYDLPSEAFLVASLLTEVEKFRAGIGHLLGML
jgi:aspartate/methionine/tyrosine aminotransferase